MEDLIIIEKCKGWDFWEFSIIYDKYVDLIYKFIYLKTTNKEVSEDLTQEVFFSVINKISTFQIKEGSSFKAWIYKIAYNKTIDFYKKNREILDIKDYLDYWDNIDFWKNIDNKDKLKEIFQSLQNYKKEHREVFLLRIWNDLNYSEIAEITWLKKDNCKKIVSRMLKEINSNMLVLLLFLITK